MKPPQGRTSFLEGLPPVGPTTKWLCIAILGVSLIGSVTGRKLGFGLPDLVFIVPSVLEWELWRLFTYPFVQHQPFGLIVGVFVFWLFGRIFESRWGSRDFLRFVGLSWVGAALLAIPLSYLINLVMPFDDTGYAEGPGPAIDALLVYLALTAPDSNILFGFVLPMKTRTVVYLVLGFELIVGILTGTAGLSITLGGIMMGYVLTTGIWRPERLIGQFRDWDRRRRRKGIYVVPPPDDHHTLH